MPSEIRNAASLPLKRVIVYKHGIAFLEHHGEIEGNQTFNLRVKGSDLNDVLKSLTVFDQNPEKSSDKINIQVFYQGRNQIQTTAFGAVQNVVNAFPGANAAVQIGDLQAFTTFIVQVKGCAIRVKAREINRTPRNNSSGFSFGTGTTTSNNTEKKEEEKPQTLEIEGRVLGLETINANGFGSFASQYSLVILEDTINAIKRIYLDDVISITLLDAELIDELQLTLDRWVASKRRDISTLDIALTSNTQKSVALSYIIQNAIWKTSYRVLLPSSSPNSNTSNGSPVLQGWAIVDNTSEMDWKDVTLTLASGSPLSFSFDLASHRHIKRPFVTPEGSVTFWKNQQKGRILPQQAQQQQQQMQQQAQNNAGLFGTTSNANTTAFSFGSASPFGATSTPFGSTSTPFSTPASNAIATPAPITYEEDIESRDSFNTIDIQIESVQVGNLSHFEVSTPVTVARGQSTSVPFLQETLDGKKVAYFTYPNTKTNPLASIMFTNNLSTTLDKGPVVVLEEETYVGEAMLDTLKPGEETIIPYSAEQLCTIDTSQSEKLYKPTHIRVADGIISFTQEKQTITAYSINNKPSSRSLQLVLDHNRQQKNELKQAFKIVDGKEIPISPSKSKAAFHRYIFDVAAQQKLELKITETRKITKTWNVVDVSPSQIQKWRNAGIIDDGAASLLNSMCDMAEQIDIILDNIAETKSQEFEILGNQERIRLNIQSLPSHLIDRNSIEKFLLQLQQQEDSITQLRATAKTLRKQWKAKLSELNQHIKNATYDANLAAKETSSNIVKTTINDNNPLGASLDTISTSLNRQPASRKTGNFSAARRYAAVKTRVQSSAPQQQQQQSMPPQPQYKAPPPPVPQSTAPSFGFGQAQQANAPAQSSFSFGTASTNNNSSFGFGSANNSGFGFG